ncbi:MAG: hypothetical protein PF630_03500 [Gammaproteobacteria bacterium]|jgi:hypothetical protein|nr:hypothetical protein [Gammaproteobacteria bacterium]
MNYLPKLFLLFSLVIAVVMLLPQSEPESPPPPQLQEYQSPPLVRDDSEPEPILPLAAAQSGVLEYTSSEQIGADRAVDFPADI